MLKIKLMPQGKKHQLSYKIVVSAAQSKHDGKFVEQIGFWYPFTKTVNLDQEKLKYWQKSGAQITIGVDKLINPDKYSKKTKSL